MGIALAVVVALVAASQGAEPPTPIPAWLVIGVLLAMPGLVALGALRQRRFALVAVAGALCVLQAFIAFSGVTIPFLIPGAVLIAAASGAGDRVGRSDVGLGALAVAAWLAAWVARLGLVEERCWPIAGGTSCSTGALTISGGAIALSLVAAAVALAALAPARPEPAP